MNKFLLKKNILNIAVILLIAIFFAIDRYLKFLASTYYEGKSQSLLGDFLSFSFVKNYYIAFSIPLPENLIIIFSLLALVGVVLIMAVTIRKKQQLDLLAIWLFLIFMGAISNLIDRFSLGYVIDYLNFAKLLVLNVADIMISLGTLMTVISFYKQK